MRMKSEESTRWYNISWCKFMEDKKGLRVQKTRMEIISMRDINWSEQGVVEKEGEIGNKGFIK